MDEARKNMSLLAVVQERLKEIEEAQKKAAEKAEKEKQLSFNF